MSRATKKNDHFNHSATRARARTVLTTAAVISSLALASPAHAESGLEGLGRALSDTELSEMRGKFIRASNIHFFGIELVQSWQSADGVTLNATMVFNVDFANGAGNLDGATPQILVSWDRICDACADPSMDVTGTSNAGVEGPQPLLTIGRFASVEGLIQTQEIAGSDNTALNSMNVSVVPASSLQSLREGSGDPIASSASMVTGHGETVDFEVARNQLGVSISRGDDLVQQGVSGELNQAAQHIVLQSSLNSIRNEMAITIGVNDLAQAQQHSIQSALLAMKGRGM